MAAPPVPLLLVPRFTTYVRDGDFPSIGLDVSPFASAVVHVWRGKLIGTSPGVTVRFEESMEQDSWSACAGGSSFAPQEDVVETKTLTLSKRLLRVVFALTGTDVAVTAHVFGHMMPRSGA
ncbi:MAG: hypothetical protein L0206_01270 [Actinobacteria bacterium]|nr:hypothetical protein [Actinomycetota bacterium]